MTYSSTGTRRKRVYVEYPFFIRVLSKNHAMLFFETLCPIYDTLRILSRNDLHYLDIDVNLFAETLYDVLNCDYEGYLLDIEVETNWLTIIEEIEIHSLAQPILRWFDSLLNYGYWIERGSLRPFSENTFVITE